MLSSLSSANTVWDLLKCEKINVLPLFRFDRVFNGAILNMSCKRYESGRTHRTRMVDWSRWL